MKTPTMMQRSSIWSWLMTPSRTESTTARATAACAGPNIWTACVAPLIVTLLDITVSGFAGRFGATTARRFVWPSFWLMKASANASPTGPSFDPISRSMWATSFPSPTRDSPTMKEPAIRASPRGRVDSPPRPFRRPQGRVSCGGASYTMARMAVKEGRRPGSDRAAGPRFSAAAVAGAAQLSCVLEASADKPGNITPRHDFADTSYEDMLRSAIAVGPELGRAGERAVGETVLACVQATRRVAGANTNLGIALLLAPLARAALAGGAAAPLRDAVEEILGALALDDAVAAYEAIRVAGAGGLDEPVEQDVRARPPVSLREAMVAAADRASVAAEYATGFALTFELGLPALRRALDDGVRPRPATV